MDELLQDIRYAWRVLARRPGFTVVAVLSLALGIGANTTIFTVINAVYLRPVPVEEPSRLAWVFTTDAGQDLAFGDLSPMAWGNYLDFRDQNDVFSGLVATQGAGVTYAPAGGGEPRVLQADLVTGNYFEVLGVEAHLGRTFGPAEDEVPGRDPVVVLSHGLWERELGADPGIVGEAISLNGQAFTVVGVTPPGFKGLQSVGDPDRLWVPFSMYAQVLPPLLRPYISEDERRALILGVFGRLEDGVALEQAEAVMATIARRLEERFPVDNESRSVAVVPYTPVNPQQADQFGMAGTVLMVVVGLVLLIACVNVANLLLVRAVGRQREIGIRVVLGAPRWRLLRQLLTESVLMAVAGGLVGLLVALWGRSLLWSFRPPFLGEEAISLNLDLRVLGFTAAVSLLTGVAFGLFPALQGSNPRLTEALHQGGRGSGGRRQQRTRTALVAAEIALALVALIGAGLFLRSMQAAAAIDPGYDASRLMMVNVDPVTVGYDEAGAQQLYERIRTRVASVGGVSSVALGGGPPPSVGFMRTTFPEGRPRDDERSGILTLTAIVSPDYFETVGIPLLRGRGIEDRDRPGSSPVAVVSSSTVQRFWPDEDPLGKRFTFFGADDTVIEVVGVVGEARVLIGQPSQPIIYLSAAQRFQGQMTVIARTEAEPEAVIADVQAVIRELEPRMALTGATTARDFLDQQLWPARMGAALLGTFGILALVLAAIGIYGVMSYTVSERSREIGIRMALGAGKGTVIGMLVRQGLVVVAAGVAVGVVVALALASSLQDLLYEVSPTDPVTFVAAAGILALVALLAIVVPARRVLSVNPVRTLKAE